MKTDATNLQNPWMGPGLPLYPEVDQLCRITNPPVVEQFTGKLIYPAAVQQFFTPLGLRDRERCYLFEPNGIQLGPGYYNARLVTNYQGAPLYVVTCCVLGQFGSSSSSSSSGPSFPSVGSSALPFPPGSPVGVLTTCCPNTLLPLTMHGTFFNKLGCPCVDGEVLILTYSNGSWTGTNSKSCFGLTLKASVQCIGNTFVVTASCGTDFFAINQPTAPGNQTCSPLFLSFILPTMGVRCCLSDGANVTFTVTQ